MVRGNYKTEREKTKMSNPNISVDLQPNVVQQVIQLLQQVIALLPFLINLTPEERKTLFKMGPKGVPFVQLALTVAQQHPGILPANFDTPEFAKDVSLVSGLIPIDVVVSPLREGVSDTVMLAGVEAMRQANIVYDMVKIAAKNDSAMNDLKNQLGERYKNVGKKNPGSGTNPA